MEGPSDPKLVARERAAGGRPAGRRPSRSRWRPRSGVTKLGYVSPEAADGLRLERAGRRSAPQAAAETHRRRATSRQDGAGYEPTPYPDPQPVRARTAPSSSSRRPSGYRPRPRRRSRRENDIPVLIYDNPDADRAEGLVADIGDRQPGGRLPRRRARGEHDADRHARHRPLGRTTPTGTSRPAASSRAPARVNPDIQFHAGRRSARPAMPTLAGGNRVTQQVIAAGADIVFGMGDGSSFGMLAAPSRPPRRRRAPTRPGSSTSSATSRRIDEQRRRCSRRSCGTSSRHSRRPWRTSRRARSARRTTPGHRERRHLPARHAEHVRRGQGRRRDGQAGIADGSITVARRPRPPRQVDALIAARLGPASTQCRHLRIEARPTAVGDAPAVELIGITKRSRASSPTTPSACAPCRARSSACWARTGPASPRS